MYIECKNKREKKKMKTKKYRITDVYIIGQTWSGSDGWLKININLSQAFNSIKDLQEGIENHLSGKTGDFQSIYGYVVDLAIYNSIIYDGETYVSERPDYSRIVHHYEVTTGDERLKKIVDSMALEIP
jgi:hypothetical protein